VVYLHQPLAPGTGQPLAIQDSMDTSAGLSLAFTMVGEYLVGDETLAGIGEEEVYEGEVPVTVVSIECAIDCCRI